MGTNSRLSSLEEIPEKPCAKDGGKLSPSVGWKKFVRHWGKEYGQSCLGRASGPLNALIAFSYCWILLTCQDRSPSLIQPPDIFGCFN